MNDDSECYVQLVLYIDPNNNISTISNLADVYPPLILDFI